MRVVFMGTPRFAVPSLDAVAAAFDVVAVYTRPDTASGRGSRLMPSPVKLRALERGIPVRQPPTLRSVDVVAQLRESMPDVICVAAYGMILPQDVLDIPRQGCLNVHASLLPRHRGAAPIERAILSGDAITGVSIMRMEEGLDTGPYALQVPVMIGDADAESLADTLAEAGAGALVTVLNRLGSRDLRWIEQDEAAATYAAKISRADVAIDPSLTTAEALRRIRAATSRATTRIALDGQEMVLLDASLSGHPLRAGEAQCTKSGVVLGFSDGALEIQRLRPAGRGAMTGAAWVCGLRDEAASCWYPA